MSEVLFAQLDPALRDLYGKKSLESSLLGRRLRLDVPVDVFSSFQIDRGTRMLLREVAAASPAWATALDLGCGYGPIALHLAAAGWAGRVTAVDRDALAVAFTAANARLNGLDNVEARGAIAYEGPAAGRFDAIVINLPAKAGESVHRAILLGASHHLTEGGEVWMVVVRPLEPSIDAILAAPTVRVLAKAAGKEHVVYRYGFTGPAGPAEVDYARTSGQFRWKSNAYSLRSLHGLPDFDTRSWASDAVMEMFRTSFRKKPAESVRLCNACQGHVAVLITKIAPDLAELTLVSRDLLALKATAANLARNGYRGRVRRVHGADFHGGSDGPLPELVVAALNEKEGLDVNVDKLMRLLEAPDPRRVIVGCKANFAGRLHKALVARGVRTLDKKKAKGCWAYCLQA